MPLRLRAAPIAVAALVVTVASAVGAAPVRITLSRPAQGSDLLRELTSRVAGEIVAVGFSVDLQIDSQGVGPADETPSAATITIGPGASASDQSAVIQEGSTETVLEITIGRRVVYSATIEHHQVTTSDGGRVLAAAAVRAVAVLQAALREPSAEGLAPKNSEAPATPPKGAGLSMNTNESKGIGEGIDKGMIGKRIGKRIGLSGAFAVLHTIDGIGPTIAPMARLIYFVSPRLGLAARGLAAGSSVLATAPAGAARVRQDLAIIEGIVDLRPGKSIRPLVMGGLGAYHMNVRGNGNAPYIGREANFWGVAADFGLALRIDLAAWLSATWETHVLWVWPQPIVEIGPVDVGGAGRPSLLHALGLVVWL